MLTLGAEVTLAQQIGLGAEYEYYGLHKQEESLTV
jgi:opacity protein-like surface antigen